MPRHKGVNKSALVRELLTTRPELTTPDIIRELKKKKIIVTSSMVATTRCQLRGKGSKFVDVPLFQELQSARKFAKMCGGTARAIVVLKELDSLIV